MRRVVMSHPLHNERWQLLTGKIVGYRRPTNKNSRSGEPRYLIQFEEGLGQAEDEVLRRTTYSPAYAGSHGCPSSAVVCYGGWIKPWRNAYGCPPTRRP